MKTPNFLIFVSWMVVRNHHVLSLQEALILSYLWRNVTIISNTKIAHSFHLICEERINRTLTIMVLSNYVHTQQAVITVSCLACDYIRLRGW